MKHVLSLIMITKNADELLDRCLESAGDLVDEIIAVDDYSTDKTEAILAKHKARIYKYHAYDLGKQRSYALKKARGDWILVLDADELLTEELKQEIRAALYRESNRYAGYLIPFQTHFLGKPLHYGGEAYRKMILFKKDCVVVKNALIHEKYEIVSGKIGVLQHKVLHYSYRSLRSMCRKFTDYAFRDAKDRLARNESVGLKQLTLYPIHMFWSRFIKDKGYKDGLFRIPLDLGFAYMEWLAYVVLLISKLKSR